MKKQFTLILLLYTLVAHIALAQNKKNTGLEINNRQVQLNANLPALIDRIDKTIQEDQTLLCYIKINDNVNKKQWPINGITIESIPSSGIYLASFSKKINTTNLTAMGISSWGEVMPTDKINPRLLDSLNNNAETQILVSFTKKTFTAASLNRTLEAYAASLIPNQQWKDQNVWQINIPFNKITALANAPFVLSITPLMTPQLLNLQAKARTNSGIARGPVSLGGYNLHGDGVTIGVGDNSDPEHIDYDDRLTSFNPTYSNDHSFHTTGTVGGNGIIDERFQGFSNKSHLIADFFSQVISNAPNFLQDFNMVISSNSYGNIVGDCAYSGTYDEYSTYTDQQLRDNPTLLHVFAAANDGNHTCSPYPAGFATITGSFSTAKNVLTVGASRKTQEVANSTTFSSKGPVKDGRIKPEIAGVGFLVYSTIVNNAYGMNQGTSMATPNVAGAAGLLYQRYRQLSNNQDPEGALIKNILMGGATDIDLPGPDFKTGFGLLNVAHSITILDSTRYYKDTINTNIEQTRIISIPANTAKAKITLSWHDPAATALSANTLINDLDLTVTSPSSTTTLPLILDPSPANVMNAAVQGADHTNNVEQVTLNNPPAGNYTIKVKGFNVPEINQEYFVSYDYTPIGVTLQYPFGGEALIAGDSAILYWEASDDVNTFTLSFSDNNGSTWTVINNNIAATARDYTWTPAASVNSSQCLIRIARNNTSQVSTSKPFVISARPVIALNPSSEQCPGSIKINWNPLTGISSYRVFRKIGEDMVAVATVSATNYTFTGLSSDSTYWVAVAPIVNSAIGIRSLALSRMPNDGNCIGITTPGDLKLATILTPGSGRVLTSSSLSNTQALKVIISNQDNQVANNYKISYRVNSGAWISFNYTDLISATGNRQITVDNLNLSAIGDYHITVAVTNLAVTDPVSSNDTLQTDIKQIENPALDIAGGYDENFEANAIFETVGKSPMAIGGLTKWDFTQSQPHGRIQNFRSSSVTISGAKSISMDNNKVLLTGNIAGSSYNTFTGTFNLSNYDTANWEIRCEFDYVMSGIPKFDTGNSVWVRGKDTDPWIRILDYQIDTVNYGAVFHSGSVPIRDLLSAAGQNFSTSTQIRFTQYDTSRIESSYYGNGVTIDNFKLYYVTNDIALNAIDSVYHYNCALSNQVPLRVQISNGVNNTVHDISVSYQLDNNPVVTEQLDSIAGNDTVQYTFNQTMDLSATTNYNLNVWVNVPTDTYNLNDSIINFTIKNQPVITNYPYLETFEQNDGYFYGDGTNSSWAYGTPASPKIAHAASGTKAWKTNLNGTYKSQEFSFLYSPCFNISQLSNPTLSFHIASDIEAPGTTIYDQAYIEYSNDGHTWQKLGAANQGTNWYTNDSAQAWTNRNETYWHVATIPLPTSQPVISFRFVLRSDQASEYEGLAIDDIHVYDLKNPIFNDSQFPQAISQSIAANQTSNFINGNNIGLTILNGNSNLGTVSGQAYKHAQFINADSTQYYLPKNFVIQSENTPGDSVTVRFFVPDAAIDSIRKDIICPSCSKVMEVQGLGITKYSDPVKANENNTLADNVTGQYSFIPQSQIQWVPYDIGYYAETKVKSFSEFWFNDGGPTHDQILPADIFNFSASHYGKKQAQLQWSSTIDDKTLVYELQRANPDLQFTTIATFNSHATNGSSYNYIDTTIELTSSMIFYRVKYTLTDSTQQVSVVRSLDWSGHSGIVTIFPNPVRNGVLNLDWFKGTGDGIQWGFFSITGQEIFTGYTVDSPFDGRHTFNLNDMGIAKGIYILKVRSGKEEWSFKIVYQ